MLSCLHSITIEKKEKRMNDGQETATSVEIRFFMEQKKDLITNRNLDI